MEINRARERNGMTGGKGDLTGTAYIKPVFPACDRFVVAVRRP